MGLDPSSNTGYVVLDDAGDVAVVGTLHHLPEPDRFVRYWHYAREVSELIDAYCVDLVIIEGYSYAGKFNNAFQYELGSCLRYQMHLDENAYVEVPPTSLKKFVCGKGNAKKDLMLLGVYKMWDFDTENDNEADAYGLAQFGRAIIGKPTKVPSVNFTAVETLVEKSDQTILQRIAKTC